MDLKLYEGQQKHFIQLQYSNLTQLCFRVMRVYNLATRRVVNRAYKSKLSVPENHPMEGNVQRLFHDDTLKSFFRRLTFSPDGELLIAPAGILEPAQQGEKRVNTTLVFTRSNLSR